MVTSEGPRDMGPVTPISRSIDQSSVRSLGHWSLGWEEHGGLSPTSQGGGPDSPTIWRNRRGDGWVLPSLHFLFALVQVFQDRGPGDGVGWVMEELREHSFGQYSLLNPCTELPLTQGLQPSWKD